MVTIHFEFPIGRISIPPKQCLLVFFAVALFGVSPSQARKHLITPELFSAIAGEFSGELARENTEQVSGYHRIQGSPKMADVAEKVVLAKLRSISVESKIEQFPSDGRTRYQTFYSPVGWEIREAELWIQRAGDDPSFVPYRLCRFRDVPMSVSTYSAGGAWSGDVVDVESGLTERNYSGKDVRGKPSISWTATAQQAISPWPSPSNSGLILSRVGSIAFCRSLQH